MGKLRKIEYACFYDYDLMLKDELGYMIKQHRKYSYESKEI